MYLEQFMYDVWSMMFGERENAKLIHGEHHSTCK